MSIEPRRGLFRPARHAGFSLLEVLIAVVVLSVGLLGMAGLQIDTVRATQSSLQRSQAVVLSYAIFDAMRSNRAASYDTGGMLCATPADAASRAANDRHLWFRALKQHLGDADTTCARIACAGGTCTVHIQWNDERATGGSATQTFATTSQL